MLPNAAATRIIVTMNARELRHFFGLRCCLRAQWEIRGVAERMLGLARDAAPVLFEKCGPACIAGPCSEGKLACGRLVVVRKAYQAWGPDEEHPFVKQPLVVEMVDALNATQPRRSRHGGKAT